MNFLMNGVERQLGFDLNGDGYIGGEGMMSRLERATHIDFNRDNIIGRAPDVYYGQPPMYGGGGYGYGGGAPSMGYGGYPSMGYPGPMHGHHHHHHHGGHFY